MSEFEGKNLYVTETHRIRLDDLYGWYIQNLQISIRKVDEEKLAMVTELDKDIETLREQCSDTIKQCQEKLRKISLDCEEDKVVLSEKVYYLSKKFVLRFKIVQYFGFIYITRGNKADIQTEKYTYISRIIYDKCPFCLFFQILL